MDTVNSPPNSKPMEALVTASDLVLGGGSLENIAGSQPQEFVVGSPQLSMPGVHHQKFVKHEDVPDATGPYGYVVKAAQPSHKVEEPHEPVKEFAVVPLPHPPTNCNPTYVFSAEMNKLFIQPTSVTRLDKAVRCGFQVRTNWNLSANTVVRVKLVSYHAGMTFPVQRCFKHWDDEVQLGRKCHCDPDRMRVVEATASHVVRPPPQEGFEKYLDVNQYTNERSVVVPFTLDTPLYFIFTCTNVCCCKPEAKKQLSLVFTLEHDGSVLDKCEIPIRICANPTRDYHTHVERSGAKKSESSRSTGTSATPAVTTIPTGDFRYWVGTNDPNVFHIMKQVADLNNSNTKQLEPNSADRLEPSGSGPRKLQHKGV